MTCPAAFAYQGLISTAQILSDSIGTEWPRISTYYSYEAKLHYYGTIEVVEERFDYWMHLKVDSETDKVSQRIYEDADFSQLAQIQLLDY